MALAGGLLVVLGVLMSLKIYQRPVWLPITVASVVGLGTFVTSAQGTVAAAKSTRRELARARITKASIAAVFHVSNETKINPLAIGVSVYKASRRLSIQGMWPPIHFVYQLDRVSRFRLNDIPQPSTVRWRSGKGTVGACLETGRWQHKNWSAIAQRYSESAVPTRDQFQALPAEEKSGFTYEEFIGIMHKYSEVLAVPIKSDGGATVLGVLAIDRPYDAELTAGVFDSVTIRTAVEIGAVAIRDEVRAAPILEP